MPSHRNTHHAGGRYHTFAVNAFSYCPVYSVKKLSQHACNDCMPASCQSELFVIDFLCAATELGFPLSFKQQSLINKAITSNYTFKFANTRFANTVAT